VVEPLAAELLQLRRALHHGPGREELLLVAIEHRTQQGPANNDLGFAQANHGVAMGFLVIGRPSENL
jgi:hypothetical protein